jgi:valyl-tRNA synthetase
MNLPQRYDPHQIEEKWRQYWLKENLYSIDKAEKDNKFSMVIPPPNVTGSLHMGHAWNITLQDIVARFKRMKGKKVEWVPGFDHAGIATQYVVERNLRNKGIEVKNLSKEEILKAIWEWVPQSRSAIKKQLIKLGASVDWNKERFTLDEGFSRLVREIFQQLYEDGLIYRGKYIVNWCPYDQTALSDLEVEYEKEGEKGTLWYIKYPVVDENNNPTGEYITVATTRPETMLGDTAVAVHPEDERYKHLIGKKVKLPLVDWIRKDLEGREITPYLPIIADEDVKKDFGTGAVKITPAHDPNDFTIGIRHNLPMVNIMDKKACLNENAGIFKGLDRYTAREKILEKLKEEGLLEKEEEIIHHVGRCYRCKTVIEPMVSIQWFVKTSDERLRKPATEVVEKGIIKFIPEFWKKHYLQWMYNLRDWCISRQIYWGHRIPVWYCEECNNENVYSERDFSKEKEESGNENLSYIKQIVFNIYANQRIDQVFSIEEVLKYLQAPNFVHPDMTNAQFYENFVFGKEISILRDWENFRKLIEENFIKVPTLKQPEKGPIIGFVPHAIYMLFYNGWIPEEFTAEEIYQAYKERESLLKQAYRIVLKGIKREEVFKNIESIEEWLKAHSTGIGCKNNRILLKAKGDKYGILPELVEEIKYIFPIQCKKCGSYLLNWETDVLDTWFSSALWPFGVFKVFD